MDGVSSLSGQPGLKADKDLKLLKAAQDLEVSFLTEFLKHTDKSSENSSFDGGIGEQQFGSFLHREHAKAMVSTGGIGLAETIFDSLRSKGKHVEQ